MPLKCFVAAKGYCEHREQRNSLRVSLDDSGLPPLTASSASNSLINSIASSRSTSSSSIIENIDALDANEYECVVNYVSDVIDDLHDAEKKWQSTLAPHAATNRLAAISAMAKMHNMFSLRLETLTMAICLLDRLASVHFYQQEAPAVVYSLDLKHSLATLMLASSMEEEYPLHSDDVLVRSKRLTRTNSGGDAFFWQRNFSSSDLRTVVWQIASHLNFELWAPNWLHFLRRFSKAAGLLIDEHQLAKQICLVATREYAQFVLPFLPSQLAAAAVMRVCSERKKRHALAAPLIALAPQAEQTQAPQQAPAQPAHSIRKRFKKWTKTLAHYTGYTRAEIEPIEQMLPLVTI